MLPKDSETSLPQEALSLLLKTKREIGQELLLINTKKAQEILTNFLKDGGSQDAAVQEFVKGTFELIAEMELLAEKSVPPMAIGWCRDIFFFLQTGETEKVQELWDRVSTSREVADFTDRSRLAKMMGNLIKYVDPPRTDILTIKPFIEFDSLIKGKLGNGEVDEANLLLTQAIAESKNNASDPYVADWAARLAFIIGNRQNKETGKVSADMPDNGGDRKNGIFFNTETKRVVNYQNDILLDDVHYDATVQSPPKGTDQSGIEQLRPYPKGFYVTKDRWQAFVDPERGNRLYKSGKWLTQGDIPTKDDARLVSHLGEAITSPLPPPENTESAREQTPRRQNTYEENMAVLKHYLVKEQVQTKREFSLSKMAQVVWDHTNIGSGIDMMFFGIYSMSPGSIFNNASHLIKQALKVNYVDMKSAMAKVHAGVVNDTKGEIHKLSEVNAAAIEKIDTKIQKKIAEITTLDDINSRRLQIINAMLEKRQFILSIPNGHLQLPSDGNKHGEIIHA